MNFIKRDGLPRRSFQVDSPKETRTIPVIFAILREPGGYVLEHFVGPLRPSGTQQTLWSDEIHKPRIFGIQHISSSFRETRKGIHEERRSPIEQMRQSKSCNQKSIIEPQAYSVSLRSETQGSRMASK